MTNLCWALIGFGVLAFAVGTMLAFTGAELALQPVGYWRGAIGFWVLAIALRLMADRRSQA